MIDDNYIKKHIKIYQATKSPEELKFVIEHLSNYIYHYPRKIFHTDHDIANDFYVYILERIDTILIKYNESDVRFITWFTVALRNSYYNFSKMINAKNRKYSKQTLSLDSIENGLTLHDVIEYKSLYDDINNSKLANEIFENVNKKFEMKESLIFSLHHLELFLSVIIEPLKIYFSLTLNEVYSIFEKARSFYIKKYNDVMLYQDMITNIGYKIKEYEKINKDISKLAKKKEDHKNRLNSLRFVVPYSYIAKLFTTTINVVTKVILKIKKYLNN